MVIVIAKFVTIGFLPEMSPSLTTVEAHFEFALGEEPYDCVN